jgi:hypothetical protein
MHSQFLVGFTNELVKTGAPSLKGMSTKVKAGGTMLGQKVKSMTSKVMKRSKGIRATTKGGTGLKGVVSKLKKRASVQSVAMPKLAEDDDSGDSGDDSGDAGDILRAIIEEAQARLEDQPGVDQMGATGGADDASYGTGTGKPTGAKPKAKRPPIGLSR